MTDLVNNFMEDENSRQKGDLLQFATTLPDKVDDTLLPELPMSKEEANACDKRIEGKWHEFYRELMAMKNRDGWKALGFESWDKYLRAKAAKLGIDHSTITRRIQAGSVREAIAEQGGSVRNMADSHARELDRLPSPEQKAEAWRLAQELSQSNPPEGKAAQFHHPGKVYTEFVKQAVETLLPAEEDEDDPFNPNTRQRVESKPLPPSSSAVTNGKEKTPEPTMLAYVGIEKQGDFMFLYGDDGYEQYTIPVRVADVKWALQEKA